MAAVAPEVIDRIYAAFSSEPKPHGIPTSYLGLDREEIAILLSKPLRKLDLGDLHLYVSYLFSDHGSGRDFRYYLPRILELGVWMDFVGPAIRKTGWNTFSEEQRATIGAYFKVAVEEMVRRAKPPILEIESWLRGASYFLPEWEQLLEPIADVPRALIEIARIHHVTLQRGEDLETWRDEPGNELFQKWLTSDRVQERLPAHLRVWKSSD